MDDYVVTIMYVDQDDVCNKWLPGRPLVAFSNCESKENYLLKVAFWNDSWEYK